MIVAYLQVGEMKPIYQTTFGKDTGNCFQACLASLFEIDIATIPLFQEYKSGWYNVFSDWTFEQFGLQPVDLWISDNPDWFWIPRGHHIISGLSPRGGFYHSVVGQAGKMVHDPHPSGDGLRSRESFTVFMCDPSIIRGYVPLPE
jgi:hypothetical protein